MIKGLAICLCVTLCLSSAQLLADDPTAVCLAMVTQAAHNINIATSSSQFLYTIFDSYCRNDGSTKQTSWDAGISVVIQAIPIGLRGGSSDASTAFSSFCKQYASTAQGSSQAYSEQSNVVEKALESANQCLAISGRGSTIAYRILTPTVLGLNMTIGAGNSLVIKGLSHEDQVTCSGSKVNASGQPTGQVIKYSTGMGQTLTSTAGAYSITCTRVKTQTTSAGADEYAATGLILDTNAGGFNVYWPQEAVLPLTDATQIQASLTTLNTQLSSTSSSASDSSGKLAAIASNYGNNIPGVSVTGPGGGVVAAQNSIGCPNGQYLAGLNLVWGGTCNNQCNGDGGILHQIQAVCKPLF